MQSASFQRRWIGLRRLKTLAILSVGSATTLSCVSGPPRWDGAIYRGDHVSSSITRGEGRGFVSCSDPAIDKHVCMSVDDFKRFVDTYVIGCVKWSKDDMGFNEYDAATIMKLYRSFNGL